MCFSLNLVIFECIFNLYCMREDQFKQNNNNNIIWAFKVMER